jgi:transposase
MRWIGLDVHHEFIQATEVDDLTGKVKHYRINMTEESLQNFKLGLGDGTRVVLEASTQSFRLAEELKPHAGQVVVANPSQTSAATAYHVKTDRRDAENLARLLMSGLITPVWQPDQACRGLRKLLEYRWYLRGLRAATICQAKALLRDELMPYPSGFCGKRPLESLNRLAWSNVYFAAHAKSLGQVREFLNQEIEEIDVLLTAATAASPEARLLQTIPGVGPVVSAILLCQIGDIERFPSPAKLCAYAGIVPKVQASGKTVRMGGLSRNGSRLLRCGLWIATTNLVRHDGHFWQMYEKMAARRPRRVAKMACARKLLTVVWHMLQSKQEFRTVPAPPCADPQQRKSSGRYGELKNPSSSSTVPATAVGGQEKDSARKPERARRGGSSSKHGREPKGRP